MCGAFGENDSTRRRTSDPLSVTRFFVKKRPVSAFSCGLLVSASQEQEKCFEKGNPVWYVTMGLGSRVGHAAMTRSWGRLPAEVDG
jgi:hypothetical protein